MTQKKRNPQRPQVNRKSVVNFKASKSAPHSDAALQSLKIKMAAPNEMENTQSATERLTERSTPAVTEGTDNQSTDHLASSKRSREQDDDGSSSHLSKRSKADGNNGPGHPSHHPAESPTTQDSTKTGPGQGSNPTDNGVTQAIPAEVQHLDDKYEFTTMSILSSAKIEQKVRNLIDRVSKFSFADIKMKPGVVILHAKAGTAGKMVSIVQIAKQEIEKDKGKWYQYSKLHGEMTELKAKEPEPKGGGHTLAEWSKGKASTETVMTTSNEVSGGVVEVQKDDVMVDDEDEEMGDDFETMTLPNRGLSSTGGSKKVRAVPIMTIYFARVPIPGLREIYGEQTNA